MTTAPGAAAPTPSYLFTPPSTDVPPPVTSNEQSLPFEALSWQDFERLCYRLAAREGDVEFCRIYGVQGDEQFGIDIFSRLASESTYRVYQCKREKDFGPAKIEDAVDKFLAGEWRARSSLFVVCTMESLRSQVRADALERAAKKAKQHGITVLPWDCDTLSAQLKSHPDVVDDFFGRPWVRRFLGDDAAGHLEHRLTATEVREFRRECSRFYETLSTQLDPGIPIGALAGARATPLRTRYVLPRIGERVGGYPAAEEPPASSGQSPQLSDGYGAVAETAAPERAPRIPQLVERDLETFLIGGEHSLIIGGAGAGKSSLLRYLALDLLSDSPGLTQVAHLWGSRLPVIVPFALWTHLVRNDSGSSLSDAVLTWLKGWDQEGRLGELFRNAIRDERLLLLVDGLDEGVDQAAANLTFSRLRVCVEHQHAPCVITSRPHGAAQLSLAGLDWARGEILPLTDGEQRQLARLWFDVRHHHIHQRPSDAQAEADCERFCDDLERSADLRELASVPLLLSLLIHQHFSGLALPSSRFEAYEAFVDHLTRQHPLSRRAAACVPSDRASLSSAEVRVLLEALAFEITSTQRHSGLPSEEAAALLAGELSRDSGAFGVPAIEARRLATELLRIGEEEVGLLVKRSPELLGFIHRSLQDYMAAQHLVRMEWSRQETLIRQHVCHLSWREVILAALRLTPGDVQKGALVALVRDGAKSVDFAGRLNVRELAAEIAFGSFRCPANTAREIANEVFDSIEANGWMPHRARLLDLAMGGLSSVTLRELTWSRLRGWYPCRASWRTGLFAALSSWPPDAALVAALVRAIDDEEQSNRRAAAGCLARLGNRAAFARAALADVAASAVSPLSRAAAIYAATVESRAEGLSDEVIDRAHRSPSSAERVAAIHARICRQQHTDDDLAFLLQCCEWGASTEYTWGSSVVETILAGWPGSAVVKQQALKTVTNDRHQPAGLDRGKATRMLLEGFPHDQDVAGWCAHVLEHEEHPFLGADRYDGWKLIADKFRDNEILRPALKRWADHQDPQVQVVEICLARLAAHDDEARAALIELLGRQVLGSPNWPASVLLEGWGIHDEVVRAALLAVAGSDVRRAAWVGHLLPQIIEDHDECYSRLRAILEDQECVRFGLALEGVSALGRTPDTTLADFLISEVLVRRADTLRSTEQGSVLAFLFRHHPEDPRVRALAVREIKEHSDLLGAVARGYNGDPEIRSWLLNSIAPLPEQLRHVIADRLGPAASLWAKALESLERYDQESDETVKTAAVLGLSRTLRSASSLVPATVIDLLRGNASCYGHDYQERRRAAFAGLVVLKRLDVMNGVLERFGEDRAWSIHFTSRTHQNGPFVRTVATHWSYIRQALGVDCWRVLGEKEPGDCEFWSQFADVVGDCPEIRSDLERALDAIPSEETSPELLRYVARTKPRSRTLLERCLGVLFSNVHGGIAIPQALTAARLVGQHFTGQQDVLAELQSRSVGRRRPADRVIAAVFTGWPDSDYANALFDALVAEKARLQDYAVWAVTCARSASDVVLENVENLLSGPEWAGRVDGSHVIPPLSERLRRDDAVCTRLIERLRDGVASSGERASLPGILFGAGVGTEELRNWCEKQLENENAGPPTCGFDLATGQVRPLIHTLLDAIAV